MKTIYKILLLPSFAVFASQGVAQTVDCKVLKDAVLMKDGKVFVVDKNGSLTPVTADLDLNGTKVSKNGDYKPATGTKTKLKNGDVITSKGELFVLAEQLVKVDGAILKDGKVWLVKDGSTTLVEADADFGVGLKVSPSGLVSLKDGNPLQLSEGEIVNSNGELLKRKEDLFSLDGISVKNGKAQKWDGSKWTPIAADLTLGNTGTKVSPDGVLISKDGTRTALKDGDVVGSKGELAVSKSEVISDGIFKRDGKMYQLEKGKLSALSSDKTLSNGYVVSLDGQLSLNAADKVALREGEIVLPNGDIAFIKGGKVNSQALDERKTTDHYIFRGGKMIFIKDGEPQVLAQDLTLPNGNKLLKHGHIMKKDGTKHILKEGEKISVNGDFIIDKSKADYDEKNNVVLKFGKMVQVKDGKEFPMTSELLLPDWSKVQVDGTLEKANGTKIKLKEGERFNMEGEPMAKINTGYTGGPVNTAPNNATASTNKNTVSTPTTTTAPATQQTFIVMKTGKLIIQMGAKEIPMSKERLLNNGTKIQLDGNVVKKDGSKFTIKEGEKVDYNTGELIK